MKIEHPKFETKEELYDYLVKNVDEHIYQKKQAIKYADACGFVEVEPIFLKEDIEKAEGNTIEPVPGELMVKAVINTTNILDSHGDVHVKGLWDKSLKENKRIKHLQEHQMKFDKVISDKGDLRASVKDYN